MSSRTVDFPGTAASSAAGTQGSSRANPVCTEIGVSVQGSSHASGSGQTSQPFLEQTTTVIVFAQGAVVRLSDTVAPGQILIVRHLQSNEEAACRVVSVKTNPNVKGYVELEFLQPTPGFWGPEFQTASAAKSPSTVAPRPVAPIRAEQDASTIRAEHVAPAEHDSPAAPKAPAAPRPVTAVPASRSTASPSETGTFAPATAISFLPDLLDSLSLPGEAKQRTAPPRAERDAVQQSAAPKPPLAPWPSAPTAARTDVTKGTPAAGDGRYVSDLLDTLTPIGETILREKQKNAATTQQFAPPAPPISRPAFVAPVVAKPPVVTFIEPAAAESALPSLAIEEAPAATQASSARAIPSVSAEVAPMLASSDVVARGQLLGGDISLGETSKGLPKPMRILGIAAAIALLLAGGAFVYRWEKKAGPEANLSAANQPAANAPAPNASAAPPAAAQSAADVAPAAAVATPDAAATTKNSRGSAQPAASAPSAATKAPAAAPTPKASPAPRGAAVAGTAISAPSAASRSTNQAAPAIGGAMPNAAQSASAGGIFSEGASSGPAAPPPARTSTGVQQPHLLSAPAPIYPAAARAENVQGDVSVDMLINEAGKIAGMTVVSGPAMLRQAALDALRERKYAPAMLDGKPTSAHIVVVIHFQIWGN